MDDDLTTRKQGVRSLRSDFLSAKGLDHWRARTILHEPDAATSELLGTMGARQLPCLPWVLIRLLLVGAATTTARAGGFSGGTSAPAPAGTLSALSWNIHWQCGSDHLKGCRTVAAQKFAELVSSPPPSHTPSMIFSHRAAATTDPHPSPQATKW